MAILSKIRERSVFLILIIGLALLAFVLDPSSLQNLFQSNKVDVVGEVNGETISREDFAAEVEQYKARYGRASNQQAMNFLIDFQKTQVSLQHVLEIYHWVDEK